MRTFCFGVAVLVIIALGAVGPDMRADAAPTADSVLARELRLLMREPRPDVRRLDRLQIEFQNYRTEVITRLTRGMASAESRLRAVDEYFSRFSLLLSLWVRGGRYHGPDWLDGWTLVAPAASLGDLPDLEALSIVPGGEGPSLEVTRSEEWARIRVSPSVLQGIEAGTLANPDDPASLLTVVQYLAARQLQENFSVVLALRATNPPSPLVIPYGLVAKMQTLGLRPRANQEVDDSHHLESLRRALAETGAERAGRFPRFVTPALRKDLARTGLGSLAAVPLESAEIRETATALAAEVATAPWRVSGITAKRLASSLREVVADAKSALVLQALSAGQEAPRGDGERLAREEVLRALEVRRLEYASGLADAELESWATEAMLRLRDSKSKRQEFRRALLEAAPEISDSPRASVAFGTALPLPLLRAIIPDLAALHVRPGVAAAVTELARMSSFPALQKLYAERLGEFARETLDPLPSVFSDRIDPRLVAKIQARLAEGRRADLAAFQELGHWLKLDQDWSNAGPTGPPVMKLLPEANRRERYYSALRQEQLDRNPILRTRVRGRILADRLREMRADEAGVRLSESLVEEALGLTLESIRTAMTEVGAATRLEDLPALVQGSVLMARLLRDYPQYRDFEANWRTAQGRPGSPRRLLVRYGGPYAGGGFGALMVLHLARKFVGPAGPFVEVLLSGLAPYVKSYIRSATSVIVAESAMQALDLRTAHRTRAEEERFFAASFTGAAFLQSQEVEATVKAYRWAKWSFVGRMATDGVFIYLPMARSLVRGHVREDPL